MPNKSLGQHWLKDRLILEAIADCAEISLTDTVLEIGPGLGTLTSVLLSQAKEVIAVEFDPELARKLPAQFPGKQLTVHTADILSFNLTQLPHDYVVVANVPYYITSKIVQLLSETSNPPKRAVLLVQKEVAERIAAKPGDMSMLSISAQIFSKVSLGPIVGAEWFTPPPKVDSRVVVLERRETPFIPEELQKDFFRLVRIGFSERRKMMRSTLSAGLHMSKPEVSDLMSAAGIEGDVRAQELSLEQWRTLLQHYLSRPQA